MAIENTCNTPRAVSITYDLLSLEVSTCETFPTISAINMSPLPQRLLLSYLFLFLLLLLLYYCYFMCDKNTTWYLPL